MIFITFALFRIRFPSVSLIHDKTRLAVGRFRPFFPGLGTEKPDWEVRIPETFINQSVTYGMGLAFSFSMKKIYAKLTDEGNVSPEGLVIAFLAGGSFTVMIYFLW